jgi:hypothetical protein
MMNDTYLIVSSFDVPPIESVNSIQDKMARFPKVLGMPQALKPDYAPSTRDYASSAIVTVRLQLDVLQWDDRC